jgi:hypothetical protein
MGTKRGLKLIKSHGERAQTHKEATVVTVLTPLFPHSKRFRLPTKFKCPPQSGPHFSGPPTRTHPTTRVHAAAARNSLVRQRYPPTDSRDPQDCWPTCSDWGGRIRDTSRDTTQLKAALSPSPPLPPRLRPPHPLRSPPPTPTRSPASHPRELSLAVGGPGGALLPSPRIYSSASVPSSPPHVPLVNRDLAVSLVRTHSLLSPSHRTSPPCGVVWWERAGGRAGA